MTQVTIERDEWERMNRTLEVLAEQVQYLTEQRRASVIREQMWEDFFHDVSPVTREMMEEVTGTLTALEQKGYFAFARQLPYIADEIVTSFSEDDVRQLGDNVVLILKTVKAMTQPEIMLLLGHLTSELAEVEQHPETLPTSFFGLLRQLRDPEVRRGMGVALALLKAVAPPEGQLVKSNGHS
jgi:uncharacterized protein YjgD (DUF1641 family)